MKTLALSREFLNIFKKQMNKAIGENCEDIKLCEEINRFVKETEFLNVSCNIPKYDMEIGFISFMGKTVNFKLNELEEFLFEKLNKDII